MSRFSKFFSNSLFSNSLLRCFFSIGVFFLVLFFGVSSFEFFRSGPLLDTVRIDLERGSSLRGIGVSLEKAGAVRSSVVFTFFGFVLGFEESLQAGEYELPSGISLYKIFSTFGKGSTVSYSLTVPEGLTVRQIVLLLEQEMNLTDSIDVLPIEGSLMPDTYYYTRGSSRSSLIERMESAMSDYVSDVWQGEMKEVSRKYLENKQELLIMASLIERETGSSSERGRVAGVFYNRLSRGMKLQTDPTLVYWESGKLGILGRGLRRSELLRDHPYNTYTRYGFPPTAIANAGRSSIQAALHPVESKELYFVADGEGGHRFARTLVGHMRNVNLWRAIEAKRKGLSRKGLLEKNYKQ